FHALAEEARLVQGLALAGGPGADLAAAGARGEICVRLLVAHALDAALHPHLLLQDRPVEAEARLAPHVELPRLAAAQVRADDEAALVDTLEQDHPHRGPALRVGGGERHRIGKRPPLRLRAPQRRGEAGDRIHLLHRVLRAREIAPRPPYANSSIAPGTIS